MRAVFLDRDGTLNRPRVRQGRSVPPADLASFEIYPEAAAACALLKREGFLLVVATNQPDVGLGLQSHDLLLAMHAELLRALPIDRIEVSFDPDAGDYKPAPGMLLRAARALDIDLGRSAMVGDRWRDVDCGRAAGCRTVFIDRGAGEPLRSAPDVRVYDLLEAARWITERR